MMSYILEIMFVNVQINSDLAAPFIIKKYMEWYT